jgi:uncharacterized membrane protein HdeD (DUF308 family)
MGHSLQFGNPYLSALSKNWGWMLFWGIICIVLGILAIGYATIASLISVMILGCIILAGGILVLVNTFTSWRHKLGGFILHLILAALYIITGYLLITNPVWSLMSLTLLLGILYIALGIAKLIYTSSARLPNRWKWHFFSGLITLLLGILIITQWPISSFYIIGLFIGIDLVFSGLAYSLTALSIRRLQ